MRVFLRKKFPLLLTFKKEEEKILPLSTFTKRTTGGSFGLGGIMLICLLLLSNICLAQFSISDAKTRLVDNVYLLDAKLNYQLTEVSIEALQHGISLTLVLAIMIERDRWYLWDEMIAKLKQRYEIKYYALSKQYVVKYINTGIEETFGSLESALTRIGNLENFPLIDKHLIKHKNATYWVYLRIYLDIEALPAPLRPIAYLSSQWRLSSNWHLCSLQP